MEKTIVYLIRHSMQQKFKGEYESVDSSQTKNEKIILSVEGEKLAEEFAKNDALKNIDALYTSNYVRAISTAKYIAENNNLIINIDEKLGERKLRKS